MGGETVRWEHFFPSDFHSQFRPFFQIFFINSFFHLAFFYDFSLLYIYPGATWLQCGFSPLAAHFNHYLNLRRILSSLENENNMCPKKN